MLTAGTSAANSFVITGPLSASTVTVHGLSGNETFTVSGVDAGTELNLYGHAGGDTFNILSSDADVNVIGDDPVPFGWADTLNLGAGNLDTITGTVAFAGGAGQDSIVLNDTTGPVGRVLTITSSSIDPNGAAGYFPYSGVENITYHGTAAADRLIVNSLGRESTVELFGYAGGDTFLVSNDAHNVDAVLGTVIVHGDAEPTTSPRPPRTMCWRCTTTVTSTPASTTSIRRRSSSASLRSRSGRVIRPGTPVTGSVSSTTASRTRICSPGPQRPHRCRIDAGVELADGPYGHRAEHCPRQPDPQTLDTLLGHSP